MSKLLALTTYPTLKLPQISEAFQRLNLFAAIASRYASCGLHGVAEILGGTEISEKHSIIFTSCCTLFKENPRLLKEFPKKLYSPEISWKPISPLKISLKCTAAHFEEMQ